ncbi:MAG: VanZ family protein [Proteobacteria bacterium]|nr:VanZ family protein [Pseudomonadota bacterium]
MTTLVSFALSPRLLRPLFWLLAAFATTMALLPRPPHLSIDRYGDKFEHMLAFGVLTLVAGMAWRNLSVLTIALRLSAFGALIEVAQAWSGVGRDGDIRDWIADTAAILVAALVVLALRRWLPQPAQG